MLINVVLNAIFDLINFLHRQRLVVDHAQTLLDRVHMKPMRGEAFVDRIDTVLIALALLCLYALELCLELLDLPIQFVQAFGDPDCDE